jgi:hypothetical protein
LSTTNARGQRLRKTGLSTSPTVAAALNAATAPARMAIRRPLRDERRARGMTRGVAAMDPDDEGACARCHAGRRAGGRCVLG